MKVIEAFNVEDTKRIGYELAKLMVDGGVILLNGDLGTGKTVFTSGVAYAIGINEYITSPTCTIVNEYYGKKKLYHFDLYRIKSLEELEDIVFWEYLEDSGFVVVEWAKNIHNLELKNRVSVNITKDLEKGVGYRNIKIEFSGRYKDLEEKLN